MSLDDEILTLEQRRRQALVDRDFAALKTLFADDLVYVHMRGNTDHDPDAYIANASRLTWLGFDDEGLTVRDYGPAAVLTGIIVNRVIGLQGGEPTVTRVATTQVWDKASGAWKLRVMHTTVAAVH